MRLTQGLGKFYYQDGYRVPTPFILSIHFPTWFEPHPPSCHAWLAYCPCRFHPTLSFTRSTPSHHLHAPERFSGKRVLTIPNLSFFVYLIFFPSPLRLPSLSTLTTRSILCPIEIVFPPHYRLAWSGWIYDYSIIASLLNCYPHPPGGVAFVMLIGSHPNTPTV